MYKTIALLCAAFVLTLNAKEQTESMQRKEGGYRSFQEMISNNPTIETEVELDPILDPTQEKWVEGQFIHRAIDKRDNIKEWSEKRHGTLWGVCKKNRVYVTVHTTAPLHMYEKFSWFQSAEIPKDVVTVSTRKNKDPMKDNSYKTSKLKPQTYYVHMETGEQGLLTPAVMKQLIADDPELLEQFNRDYRQAELVIHYLEIYHRRLAERKQIP